MCRTRFAFAAKCGLRAARGASGRITGPPGASAARSPCSASTDASARPPSPVANSPRKRRRSRSGVNRNESITFTSIDVDELVRVEERPAQHGETLGLDQRLGRGLLALARRAAERECKRTLHLARHLVAGLALEALGEEV